MSVSEVIKFCGGRGIATFLVALLVVALVAPAFAQGFSVRPMRLENEVPAGRVAAAEFVVANTSGVTAQVMDVRLVDLTQNDDGSWRILERDLETDLPRGSSAHDWMRLSDTEIELEPGESRAVRLEVQMPPRSVGAQIGGLVVSSRVLGETGAAVRLQTQFLIPIILSAHGRPARQNIEVSDVTMEYVDGVDETGERFGEPTTVVRMRIANAGQTYSRLRGTVRVERQVGESWRLITVAELPTRGIIPGVSLNLPSDLNRRLPSGTYRLQGNLSADGRRIRRFETDIDFEGDPDVDILALDTTLELEPPRIDLYAVPGATRTSTVSIGNPSEQPITVLLGAHTPASLRGVAMGEVSGEDLSAASWTEIRPSELTVPPGQARNVRVISRMPREDLRHAKYFSDIVLEGSYADGQSAGETRSSLHIRQQHAEASARASIERIGVSSAEDRSYFVVHSRLANIGNVEIEPALAAKFIDERGVELATERLSSEAGELLPLGVRDFSGVVDFSATEPGEYILRVVASHASVQLTQRQLRVRIEQLQAGDDEWREMTVLEE